MEHSILALIIMAVTIVLFVSQKVPTALGAMIGALLMMAAGIISPTDLCACFGNYICVLLACTGIIGAAVFETGLASKIGALLCRWKLVKENERLFLIIIICTSGVMSIFVANIPIVAFFIPIVAAVAASSGGKIRNKHIVMAIGFASTMGGNGSLIGSSINLTGLASLEATTGDTLEMFTMLPITILLLAVMIGYYWLVGYHLQNRWFTFSAATGAEVVGVEDSFHKGKSIIVAVTFLLMMVGFMTGIWNFGIVAMISAGVCILSGCIPWKKALSSIDWNTIIVVAASFAIAAGMNTSGAGALVARGILMLCGGESASPVFLLGLAVVIASLLGCVMSNNAVVAIMIPVFCTIAQVIGSNAVTFAVAIICGCNICYATPISTAPVTMTLVGGYRFNDYVKVGGLLTIISDLAAIVLLPMLYPL